MTKRILQDVVTSPGSRSRTKISSNNIKQTDEDYAVDVRMPSASHRGRNGDNFNKKNGRVSRFAIWGIAIFAVLFLLFVLLQFFSGTIVEIVPLQKNVTIDGNFIAQKGVKETDLSFKLVVLDSSLSGEVTATGEKNVEKKASGNIIIFNKYSSKPQKLIKRTRFETPNGKIYRIDKYVMVPGTTIKNGKVTPGSVEVTVYADIPGEEYNTGLTDFTIPGFKGDPRFNKFYARSKTPIENGFSGVVKIASDEDVLKVEEELQNSLKETLLMQARSQVPEDFVLYDDAVFFSFKNTSNQLETNKDVIDITEDGTLYGVLFNKSELSKYITASTVATYDGGDVSVQDLEALDFNVSNREEFNPKEDTELRFTLTGPATIIWDINENLLVRDLVGIQKEDFLKVIEKYSNIQRAEATIRPFWKKVFPDNIEDITIRKISLE